MSRGRPETLGQRLHETLRADILTGRWAPGAKLRLAQLSAEYETSSTVVREALTRLTGERLVQLAPNRGFHVPALSLDELRDLNELRCRSEEFAIALAVERGEVAWESALMAAHHTLERTVRRRTDDPHHIAEEWEDAHRAFHATLISACGVPTLVDLCATLADATSLYRRWSAPSTVAEARDIEGEHRAILRAVLDREAERAGELLRGHYTKTIEVIIESGLVAELESTTSAH